MKAKIIDMNYGRDLYIFEREDGETGYFELLGGPDLEGEDLLKGNFEAIGRKVVYAVQGGKKYDIAIEDFCSLDIAKERIN